MRGHASLAFVIVRGGGERREDGASVRGIKEGG